MSDVVVIGAGVVGLGCAYHLRQEGLAVTVVDRDPEGDKARFARDLPLIRMICAHAAYAQARQHVDANFVAFMQDGLRKVSTPEQLDNFRALFEAIIGFSPKS